MVQIIQTGSVTRGWIGAGVQELTPELAESFKLGSTRGLLITEVTPNGPSEKAGVKTGDILIAIDDWVVADWNIMLETVTSLPPGKVVTLKLLRNGAAINLSVKIGKRPRPTAQ